MHNVIIMLFIKGLLAMLARCPGDEGSVGCLMSALQRGGQPLLRALLEALPPAPVAVAVAVTGFRLKHLKKRPPPKNP